MPSATLPTPNHPARPTLRPSCATFRPARLAHRFLPAVVLALLSVWMAIPAPVIAQHSRPSVRPHSTTEERNWMMTGGFARVRTVSPSGGDFAEPDAACTYVDAQTRSATATWVVMIYPGNYSTDCAGSPVALPTFTTLVRLENLGPTLTWTTVTTGSLYVTTSVTPASATAACTTGRVVWDASFVYVCVATNTWVRATLATW